MKLKLPFLFRDHMVLQRDMPIRVWGWANAGEKISATLADHTGSTVAGSDARWDITLPACAAGGPHTLTIQSAGESKTIVDVLIGEVWVCSGQSNMEWPLASSDGAEEAIAGASDPLLRLTTISRKIARTPLDDCGGLAWSESTPASAKSFSAVAFHFGQRLRQTLNIPIGLIHSSWGGTPAEAWTSSAAFQTHPEMKKMIDDFNAALLDYPARFTKYAAEKRTYDDTYLQQDPGNKGEALGFAKPDFDDSAWQSMPAGSPWESQGLEIDGAVWFRRAVDLPAAWAGKELTICLGALDDFDITYFNGVEIGRIGRENPDAWSTQRLYKIPAALVRAGRNVIATRVFDQFGAGGMCGPIDLMDLKPIAGNDEPLPLDGLWKYHVELALPPITKLPVPMPQGPISADSSHAPSVLYNAMIHPLAGYPIRGALWYQGETNAGRALQYRTLLPTMIESWRTAWNQGRFPFLIVQLANYMERREVPSHSDWALLREAQTLTAALPNNGLAVAIDIGDAVDIHPRNKRDVGLRLAYVAERYHYGLNTPAHGPTFQKLTKESAALRIHFDHADGLTSTCNPVRGFAIAGADRHFHWADAVIDGNTVLLRAAAVADPVAVRYAWADNPECSLYNAAGLPAVPFRTDDW
jgi:sialate O-acetylesterase